MTYERSGDTIKKGKKIAQRLEEEGVNKKWNIAERWNRSGEKHSNMHNENMRQIPWEWEREWQYNILYQQQAIKTCAIFIFAY